MHPKKNSTEWDSLHIWTSVKLIFVNNGYKFRKTLIILTLSNDERVAYHIICNTQTNMNIDELIAKKLYSQESMCCYHGNLSKTIEP